MPCIAARFAPTAQGMALLAAANERVSLRHSPGRNGPHLESRLHYPRGVSGRNQEGFHEEPGLANLLVAARFREAIPPRQAAWRRMVEVGLPRRHPHRRRSALRWPITIPIAARACREISSRPSAISSAPTPSPALINPTKWCISNGNEHNAECRIGNCRFEISN